MRLKENFEGGKVYPKHSTIGSKGALIPANSTLGGGCVLAPTVVVGSGTVVADYVKIRKGCIVGANVTFGEHARIRGTERAPVVFEEGIIFGNGAELRHCHLKRGVRFMGEALIEHCVLPSDTVFEDRIRVTLSAVKKLNVDHPYRWPDVAARPDGPNRNETPEEKAARVEATRAARNRRCEEALLAMGHEFSTLDGIRRALRNDAGTDYIDHLRTDPQGPVELVNYRQIGKYLVEKNPHVLLGMTPEERRMVENWGVVLA